MRYFYPANLNARSKTRCSLYLYHQAQQSGLQAALVPSQDSLPGNQGTFTNLVQGYLSQAEQIGRTGEQMSVAGVTGQADLAQVATSVSEAEVTLQTVVAIRDKVVDAYKEILRMPM